jgi:hypothetical protein
LKARSGSTADGESVNNLLTTASTRRIFRDDLGVFVCDHVFRASTPVLLCVRDRDASWQFLCGQDDLTDDQVHLVHFGALLANDASLAELTDLQPGNYAERQSTEVVWSFGKLDPEDDEGQVDLVGSRVSFSGR